jgi:hypothetical protein
MALHRDIYWVGRQWAVTGYGIQACNQKQKGQFDIEGSRLWEAGVLESLRAEPWLNIEDFEKALEVARKHYPEPPREAAEPEPAVAELKPAELEQAELKAAANTESPVEAPMMAAQKFELHIGAWPAKFVHTWRIRVRR